MVVHRLSVPAVALLAASVVAQDPRPSNADAKPVAAAPAKAAVEVAKPIEFAKIERKIRKLPEFVSEQPLYGLFLFGPNGRDRVWAVLDKSKADAKVYDVLYLDRNADGDLTGKDERIEAKRIGKYGRSPAGFFTIGDFREPSAPRTVHVNFELTWSAASVRFKMKWRGEEITMGCYGPTRDTYQNFATSPAKAPVFVPGYDRPFEFDHWLSGVLRRGHNTDFKVFVGNRGDRSGTFTCVDQHFLSKDDYVVATVLYKDTQGKQHRHRVKLTQRC